LSLRHHPKKVVKKSHETTKYTATVPNLVTQIGNKKTGFMKTEAGRYQLL
jgi:muramidase (phage lysozyme)